MSETKKCPACHTAISMEADRCPKCGLENLNQIFLSKKDYEAWVQEYLEPHMAEFPPKVFAGYAHALILFASGELYGIGNNDSGQLGAGADRYVEEPCLIARQVKSAAAGYNYSVYVTRDKEVKMLGTGRFAEYFQGFSGAEEVFADGTRDIFFIKAEDGRLLAFGDNNVESIVPRSEQEVYRFQDERVEVSHWAFTSSMSIGTTGFSSWTNYYDDDEELRKLLIQNLTEKEVYKEQVRLHSEDNLTLNLELISEEDKGTQNSGNYRQARTYRPSIVLYNKIIYDPIPVGRIYAEEPVYEGCGLLVETNEEWKRLMGPEIKKLVCFRFSLWMVLEKNGKLYCTSFGWSDERKDIFLKKDVYDVSAGMKRLILTDYSGDVYYCDTVDLTEGAKHLKLRRLCF